MTLTLLCITDKKPAYFRRTWHSIWMMWEGPQPDRLVLVDDSGVPAHRAELEDVLGRGRRTWLASRESVEVISHAERRGFAAAIASGWQAINANGSDGWVFHLEDDFLFERPAPVAEMMAVLDANPHLVQMSLLRQPCNAEELAAGGLVQAHPGAFVQCSDGEHRWMEQRLYFTTNPSLYRADLTRGPWPQCERSEGVFSHCLMDFGYATPGLFVPPEEVRFGVWGSVDDEPWISHFGERVGTGY